ncbi:MAG: class I SAM-dependent methyltransferase [Bacteroidales bacterium]
MVKDINKIIQNLLDFYDFKDKKILSIGAGGGQFIAYGKSAKHVIAIDNDLKALDRLKDSVHRLGLNDKFTLVHSDFKDVNYKVDVVLFEFCLHEMENHSLLLNLAFNMGQDIIIADHSVDSEWAFIADEIDKAEKSWNAVHGFKVKKEQCFKSEQFFEDYEELFNKVKAQGENSIKRIEKYNKQKSIIIPMGYKFALL